MELRILPNDVIRYIVTEFLEYEITKDIGDNLLKSLFGRFEGEKSYFLVFRHLFTRITNSKVFRFLQNDLYPKDAYSIEYRPLTPSESILQNYPSIRNTGPLHFLYKFGYKFPHLVVLKNFQFQNVTRSLRTMQDECYKQVYKLKTLHLINTQCDFVLSKNFPEIQDLSLLGSAMATNKFLDGIEKCGNLVHFCIDRLNESRWSCSIVESLFNLPNIKSLKLGDCNLRLLEVNLFVLETSVVQQVVVGSNSTKTLRALLSNPNIRSLSIGYVPSLNEDCSDGSVSPLFDLVLKKERFKNIQFDYVAGVSLFISTYPEDDTDDQILYDCMAFLTRGTFHHLKVYGGVTSWSTDVLKCMPPLKVLEYVDQITYPERIIPIMADEIILNNERQTLDDFNPPLGCKKVQLNNVAVQGDDIKRLRRLVQKLMGLGIEVTFDGLDPEEMFGKFDLSKRCFNISISEPDSNNEDRGLLESENSSENIDEMDGEDVDESDDWDDSELDSEMDQGEDGRQFKRRKYESKSLCRPSDVVQLNMELKILPNDVIRYIVTEFLEYDITDEWSRSSRVLKSLFGRFEGEKSYFLVFRHLFTQIFRSTWFHFKQNNLYPKNAYSIEYRPLPRDSDPYLRMHPSYTSLHHFLSQFRHLIVLKNFQFQEDDRGDPTKIVPEWKCVYKLKTLHLIETQCDFNISKNFPEIQDFSISRVPSPSNQFLDGIEKCTNLVHFRVGLHESLWTCSIVESLFQLPNIKRLWIDDCNLILLEDLDLFRLETSVVQEVCVGCNSTNSLRALLSNTNIHSLFINGFLRLTGGSSPLFDLVLTKKRFQNVEFDYIAGVSLFLMSGHLTSNTLKDCKAFLKRGKFDHLKVYGSRDALPKEILKYIRPLKTLEYMSAPSKPKRIVPIIADEIILNCERQTLTGFTPPPGCKRLQLNNVAMHGEEVKRLLGLGIEITFDGWTADEIFEVDGLEGMEGFESHYFDIGRPEPVSNKEDESESESSLESSESDSVSSLSESSDETDDESVTESVIESEDNSEQDSDGNDLSDEVSDQVDQRDDGRQFKRRKFESE